MEATPEILHLVIELDPAACGGAGGSPDGPLRLDIRYRVAGRPRYRVKITKGRLTPALNAALGDLFREWWLFPGPDRRDPLRVVPRLDGKGMPPEAIDALTPSLTFDLVLDEVIESWLRRPQSWGLFLMMQDPRIRLLVAGPWCLRQVPDCGDTERDAILARTSSPAQRLCRIDLAIRLSRFLVMRERRHVTLIRPVGEEQRFLAYLPLHGTKRLGRPLATTLAELGLWHRAEEDNNDPAPEPVPRYAEPSAFMPVHETLSRTLLSLSAHQILALRKNPRVLHLETGIRVLKSLPAH